MFKGKWISGSVYDYGEEDALYYEDHPNTILTRSFHLDIINQTKIKIAVLGYYIVHINGVRVGQDELNSDWTNYNKCIYYDEYDITKLLKQGNNKIEIELGNGRYNSAPLKLFGKYNLRERMHVSPGTPKVILDVYDDTQTVLSSDESWDAMDGSLVFDNLYLGERVDTTYKRNKQKLHTYEVLEHFEKSFAPKCKCFEELKPASIEEYKNGLLVDMGEMISGFISIKVDLLKEKTFTLYYSERLTDGHIDYSTSLVGSVGEVFGDGFVVPGGAGAPKEAIQQDVLHVSKGVFDYKNKFTYHSFRYIYIENLSKEELLELSAEYVHADVEKIGHVEFNHEFYNELYDAGLRTKLNNMHEVFEDCARERLGYGGDIVALATSHLHLFNLENMYKKVIRDFRYEQTQTGGIPETAPFVGIGSNGTAYGEGPILWQFVYPYLVYKLYQYYGDIEVLKEEYPYLIKQMDYLLTFPIDELAHKCLGDHGSILIAGKFRKPTPDKLFLGYTTVLLFLEYNMKISKILGKETAGYEKEYMSLKNRIEEKFIHGNVVGEGTQSGYAFALYAKLGNQKELLKAFVQKIKEDQYILNSGIFGMSFTYEILNKYGYADVLEKWLLNSGEATFKHMLEKGNKALAELFIGDHMSDNHAMFTSFMSYYYQSLAGIIISDEAVGFNKMTLQPYFSNEMNEYKASLKTKQGLMKVSWSRKPNSIIVTATIPSTIQFSVPADFKLIAQDGNMYTYEV